LEQQTGISANPARRHCALWCLVVSFRRCGITQCPRRPLGEGLGQREVVAPQQVDMGKAER